MNQTEADRLLALVLAQAKAAGIPVSRQILPTVLINTRARTRFGCCRRLPEGFRIELSAFLLDGDESVIRQTLAHEVLHTCPGCSNHGPVWQRWADLMNRTCGYRIRRTDSPEALGLADTRPVRWLVVCSSCGKEIPRMKRSPLVTHPERYRCRCGGKFSVKKTEADR